MQPSISPKFSAAVAQEVVLAMQARLRHIGYNSTEGRLCQEAIKEMEAAELRAVSAQNNGRK